MSNTPTPFLDALLVSIPAQYSPSDISAAIPRTVLDAIIRFSSGAECPPDALPESKLQWSTNQPAAFSHIPSSRKRSSDDGDNSSNKRAKIDAENKPEISADDAGALLSCLRSISIISPVRKKLDIEIHAKSILLVNPSTKKLEAPPIRLEDVKRVWVLPTRGKSAGHWTVAILCEDALPEASSAKGKGKDVAQQQQLVFGLDAKVATPISYQIPTESETGSLPKGSLVLPTLLSFISPLPSPTLQIDTGPNSHWHAVDAFKGAKAGVLYFTPHGLVSVFGKPGGVEYWAFEDIVPGNVGVRILSATGRNCSVFVARKINTDPRQGGEEDDDAPNAVEYGWEMIDGKEQEKIRIWISAYQPRFGVLPSTATVPSSSRANGNVTSRKGKGKEVADVNEGTTNAQTGLNDDSDASDGDFTVDSEDDDGGSATSDSSDSESGEEEGDAAESDEDEDEDGEIDDEMEGMPLDPKHHPLLRPGAMPKKVSRAVVDAVVGMMEDDMTGGHRRNVESEEDDQLDD